MLGTSGVTVGPLGVSGGFGAPAEAFEMAFERGCNYFYHGSLRRDGMATAIRNLNAKGNRDRLVVVAQVYTRFAWQVRVSLESFLKGTGLDHVDCLLFGWYNRLPPKRILDAARQVKERGLAAHLALSGHRRTSFPEFAGTGQFDWFHVRYNAVHRGAETDIFPHLPESGRPGIVAFTALCWGKLIKPGKMPPGEHPIRASDAYRFCLTHPSVDMVIAGPKDRYQMKEALTTLDSGPLSPEEDERIRRIGAHIYGK